MKYQIAFLSLLLGVLGVFSYLGFTVSGHRPGFAVTGEGLEALLRPYLASQKQLQKLNLSQMYGQGADFEVLHPMLESRPWWNLPASPACRESDGLAEAVRPVEGSARISKEAALTAFLNLQAPLPENFFEEPPFFDRFGETFAFVLVKKGPPPYSKKPWVESHLSHFRISELKEILSTFKIERSDYEVLSHLTDDDIEHVIRGEAFVLTNDYLLEKDARRAGFSPLTYFVYSRQTLTEALRAGEYEIVPSTPDAICLVREGNVCWSYNSKHALGYLYRYSVLALTLVGFVFAVLLLLFLRELHRKSREREKYRFSLHVLSHEFRTPVSALLLLADELSKESVRLNDRGQDLVTRISSEVHRLRRVVELSRSYLRVDGGRAVEFQNVRFESVHGWLSEFAEDSGFKVGSQFLTPDEPFVCDPFWLKFVLGNLVQNAFAHGAEPVVIELAKVSSRLVIRVRDAGNCEFQSLAEMSQPFVKSQRSQGMGLGLNIVRTVVKEWGGELEFSRSPTSFGIKLSRVFEQGEADAAPSNR